MNQTDPTNNEVFSLKRNSRENIKRWKKVLSKEEIKIIKSTTGNLANKFYTEEDWQKGNFINNIIRFRMLSFR